MTHVHHVTTRSFALELSRPLSTAAGEIARREGLLVRVTVEDDAGDRHVGLGEATPLPGWTERLPECRAALREAATRLQDAGLGTAWDEADDLPPAARHGLALALADCRARTEDRPLSAALLAEDDDSVAADSSPTVRVNATVGDADAPATADAARAAVDDGFDCLKVKVGARSVGDDLDRLAAVREAAPAVTLRADANGAWGRTAAERAFEGMAARGLDLTYVEQPLSPGDVAGHASLRNRERGRSPGTGVALDESLVETSVTEVVAAGAADAVVLKPMALGGPDRAVAAAREALAAGVTPVVTTTVDAVVARTAAGHVAAVVDALAAGDGETTPTAHGLGTAALLADDLADDPAPVEGGAIQIPEGPGTGVSPEVFEE